MAPQHGHPGIVPYAAASNMVLARQVPQAFSCMWPAPNAALFKQPSSAAGMGVCFKHGLIVSRTRSGIPSITCTHPRWLLNFMGITQPQVKIITVDESISWTEISQASQEINIWNYRHRKGVRETTMSRQHSLNSYNSNIYIKILNVS